MAFALACGPAPRPARAPAPAPAPAPRPSPPPAIAAPARHAPSRIAALSALEITAPERVGMDPALSTRIDSIVLAALGEGVAPGAAVAIGRYGRLVHLSGYGHTDWGPAAARVDGHTIYDLASLTKVVATTTLAMMLEETGQLVLDAPVHQYLPELDAHDKAAITVRMLLTHRGGLEAYAPLYLKAYGSNRGRGAYLAAINRRPLKAPPGTRTEYSDWDMVLTQLVIERITGVPLDALAATRLFAPLGLADTYFLPPAALRGRIAPTAVDTSRGGLLWGTVHDGNAYALGGVSGHAGLFSSARDLAAFAQMLLNGGTYAGVRIVQPATIARWTSPQDGQSSRALGWDTPAPGSSAGRFFSPRSFGHTGFTGTSIWIDPERSLFVVVLTNRVHSRGDSPVPMKLRRDVADAVHAAILDAPLVDWERR